MMNQTLSTYAATNLCKPDFTASPASQVTANAASVTSPQASRPMPKASSVSSAPPTPTNARRDAR